MFINDSHSNCSTTQSSSFSLHSSFASYNNWNLLAEPFHQKHDFSSFHISWTQFAAYLLSTKTSSSKSTFSFHSKLGPRGEVHSLFCLWFDVSFYNASPLGSLLCDGWATWRAHAGTKWPSRASTAQTSERSGRSGQGYDTVEAIRLLSLHWRQMLSDFRAALLCPRPQTCHLDCDRKPDRSKT